MENRQLRDIDIDSYPTNGELLSALNGISQSLKGVLQAGLANYLPISM